MNKKKRSDASEEVEGNHVPTKNMPRNPKPIRTQGLATHFASVVLGRVSGEAESCSFELSPFASFGT